MNVTLSPISYETKAANPSEPDDGNHAALDARLLTEPRIIDFHRSSRLRQL